MATDGQEVVTESESSAQEEASLVATAYDPHAHVEADRFFDDIDVNADGSISEAELRAHLDSVGYDTDASGRIYSLLDLDGDGQISREELRDAYVRYDDPSFRLALGLGTSEADAIFAKIDTNGDGEITREELQIYLEGGGVALAAQVAETMFGALDTDADGTVSQAELRKGYVQYSALRDALGMGTRPAVSPKGVPKRWGRGSKKGAAAAN